MKTNFLRIVCFAFIICLMNGFVSKAQAPFYNTKWEDGKMVSRTKCVMGDAGLYIQESVSEYTYDENGDLFKKEVYVWNPKYKRNDKGKYYPDYSDKNWTPNYCILYKKDFISNFASIELFSWNKKENRYDAPVEIMIFQMKDSNHFNYLAFKKGNRFDEVVNDINYDRVFFAGLAK